MENFEYLKSLFNEEKVLYAITEVRDLQFYKIVNDLSLNMGIKNIAISLSNIFDCGYYNGLTFQDFLELKEKLKILFVSQKVHLYSTQNLTRPYIYINESLN